MSPEFSHFDETGASRMVDVGSKPVTKRSATASGVVTLRPATVAAIKQGQLKKGDVLEVARLAGIMAAKQTGTLIPLCHSLTLDGVEVRFDFRDERTMAVQATVQSTGKTGVEMEALTAVSVTALTIYDMCKAVDKEIEIGPIRLEMKSGGKSGDFKRER